MNISREQFEEIIQTSLQKIPPHFRQYLENVAFVLEEAPEAELRNLLRLRSTDELLGLYQGVPRTRRGAGFGNALPDKITFYRLALQDRCHSEEALRDEVLEVLKHEVGHHFGMDEAQLESIEGRRPILARRNRG